MDTAIEALLGGLPRSAAAWAPPWLIHSAQVRRPTTVGANMSWSGFSKRTWCCADGEPGHEPRYNPDYCMMPEVASSPLTPFCHSFHQRMVLISERLKTPSVEDVASVATRPSVAPKAGHLNWASVPQPPQAKPPLRHRSQLGSFLSHYPI